MTTTIQLRIDKRIKEKAQKAFKAQGLDLSSGLRLFLTHVTNQGSVPFELFTADNLPDKVKKQWLREGKEAVRSGRGYNSVKEMMKDLRMD